MGKLGEITLDSCRSWRPDVPLWLSAMEGVGVVRRMLAGVKPGCGCPRQDVCGLRPQAKGTAGGRVCWCCGGIRAGQQQRLGIGPMGEARSGAEGTPTYERVHRGYGCQGMGASEAEGPWYALGGIDASSWHRTRRCCSQWET